MTTSNPVLAAHNDYAVRWSVSADSFHKQGAYGWMAAEVMKHGPRKLLDIGCGMGHGLAAMLAHEPRLDVVALDEVGACLQQTEVRLQQAGFGVERFDRLRFPVVRDHAHRVEVFARIPPRRQPITLVQANAATPDDDLMTFLRQQGPFDAMTVWLVGAHPLRLSCADAMERRVFSADSYRLMVQNRAYDLANLLLRAGGVLNLVDREGQSDDGTAVRREDRERRQAHIDQAMGTTLALLDIQSMSYEEAAGGVGMVYSPGTSGHVPASFHMRLFSVTSQKR